MNKSQTGRKEKFKYFLFTLNLIYYSFSFVDEWNFSLKKCLIHIQNLLNAIDFIDLGFDLSV